MKNFTGFLKEKRLDDRPDSALKHLVFKPQEDLKKPEYDSIKIFKDGWQRIILPSPPREDREVDAVIAAVEGATEQQKKDYMNCDKDASFYVKKHMREKNLDFDDDVVEYIEEQCSPIIRHFKNNFNRPRPYQVAALYNKTLNRFVSKTAKTPAYPSGHAMQPMVVALHYAKKYPAHKDQLVRGAKICGYGRVVAGMHYPSDYDAGVELAHKIMDFMDYDKF